MGDINDLLQGANGVQNVSDNALVEGDFFAVQVVGSVPVTFEQFEEVNASGALTGVAHAPGTIIINGRGITKLKRSGESGMYRAYRR
ncbi:hypothetical protein [Verrucomicrobium sp. BvORR034]|uniref:hypothetical protein n=1 Tax=Verrucomicrobium sp. BvORR034 TaxID=1396418 RepID=UPI000679C42A|nr:hypothetical protein [Verrucomicrobium sp. BvORR034]